VVDQCSGLDRGWLQELLTTYGPCGQNDFSCDVGPRELEPHVEETLGSGRQLGRTHSRW
jgi:hypothetical protein